MDDLEFNGITPPGGEPAKEPVQTPNAPQDPWDSGFHAWSGPTEPLRSNEPPQQPESPFAHSPYRWDAPQQPREPVTPPRQESPFANSPYSRFTDDDPWDPQPTQPVAPPVTPRYQPNESTVTPRFQPTDSIPQRPKRKKSVLPVLALITSAVALVIALVAGGQMTGLRQRLNAADKRLDAYAQRIEQLEEKLENGQSAGQPSNPQLPPATSDVPVRVPATVEGMMTPAQVYAQCVHSVVAIDCISIGSNGFGQQVEMPSSGSGFILSEDGYIVTNYHVVEGCSSISISLFDGTSYDAEYIGGNEANDIALIKVDARNLPPVTIGSSSDLIVGDQVVAIGNPLGELAATLTVGYVSAKDRIVTSEGTQINMLQTDAAINPGNSGGPLFNMKGEVVGITSAKYSGTTNSGATIEGIGFAIPTDDVIMMLEDLRTFGHITGGYLGVTVSEVDQETSELYGLPMGVLVRDVMPGSCAEKAGMKTRDIIIDIEGNEVKNLNGLSRALNKFKGGQEVTVTVYRAGSKVELTIILDERPQEEEPEVTEPTTEAYIPWPGGIMDDWFGNFFG